MQPSNGTAGGSTSRVVEPTGAVAAVDVPLLQAAAARANTTVAAPATNLLRRGSRIVRTLGLRVVDADKGRMRSGAGAGRCEIMVSTSVSRRRDGCWWSAGTDGLRIRMGCGSGAEHSAHVRTRPVGPAPNLFCHTPSTMSTRCRPPKGGATPGFPSGNRRFTWTSHDAQLSAGRPYDHGDGNHLATGPIVTKWLWRAAVVAVVAGIAARVVGRLTGPSSGAGQWVPPIGGDTWPPVPVKDTRPT